MRAWPGRRSIASIAAASIGCFAREKSLLVHLRMTGSLRAWQGAQRIRRGRPVAHAARTDSDHARFGEQPRRHRRGQHRCERGTVPRGDQARDAGESLSKPRAAKRVSSARGAHARPSTFRAARRADPGAALPFRGRSRRRAASCFMSPTAGDGRPMDVALRSLGLPGLPGRAREGQSCGVPYGMSCAFLLPMAARALRQTESQPVHCTPP